MQNNCMLTLEVQMQNDRLIWNSILAHDKYPVETLMYLLCYDIF